MKIENINIYNIEESIVASGYPMKDTYDEKETSWQIENLKYWIDNNLFEIKSILERKDNSPENWIGENGKGCVVCGKEPARKIKKYNNKRLCIAHNNQLRRHGYIKSNTRLSQNRIILDKSGEFAWLYLHDKNGNENAKCKISCEDILRLSNIRFSISSYGYAQCAKENKNSYLHKIVCNSKIVDHINRDRLDNRRENLRPATKQQNSQNRIQSNEKGKAAGVFWSKPNKKWCAQIYVNNKRVFLGYYENEDDAITIRLKAEVKYYQEFAPQNELAKKYGIINPYIKDGNGRKFNLGQALKHVERVSKLVNTNTCSGHQNFLTGLLVTFDLTASVKLWNQVQRYHFNQIVSSQSTMHRLEAMLKNHTASFNENTDKRVIELIYQMYQEGKTFEEIVYSCPMGIELTAHVTSNYLQIKTMYHQRKTHKLKEWKDFCSFVESLPYFELFIKKGE